MFKFGIIKLLFNFNDLDDILVVGRWVDGVELIFSRIRNDIVFFWKTFFFKKIKKLHDTIHNIIRKLSLGLESNKKIIVTQTRWQFFYVPHRWKKFKNSHSYIEPATFTKNDVVYFAVGPSSSSRILSKKSKFFIRHHVALNEHEKKINFIVLKKIIWSSLSHEKNEKNTFSLRNDLSQHHFLDLKMWWGALLIRVLH